MSVTSGFYNSINHDRRYNAEQFGSIYDGVINDGVFANIGDCFVVNAQSGITVTVGLGRAWFNQTWTLNDSLLPIEMPASPVGQNRIDAIVLEVNASEDVRTNSIKVLEGTAAASPVRPILTETEFIHQHPLAYIYRAAGAATIYQANITNMVGTDDCPFVTGILQVVSLDQLLGQWRSELDLFVENEEADFTAWSQNKQIEFENWAALQRQNYQQFMAENEAWFQEQVDYQEEWMEGARNTFLAWLRDLEVELSGDVAGNLQLQIDHEETARQLMMGFDDGVKTISEDGRVITTTASDGRKLIKTFSQNFDELVTELRSAENGVLASQTKIFSADGRTITTTTVYS